MIDANSLWTFSASAKLAGRYGHVQVLPDQVLGQWFCLDRQSGKKVWEKKFVRPETVRGIAGNVVVATETRSDGPWTLCFGIYGISLVSGELLWSAGGQTCGRRDDVTTEESIRTRDCPVAVDGDEIICRSRRVLDSKTGRLLRVIPLGECLLPVGPDETDAEVLYAGFDHREYTRVEIGRGLWLSHKTSDREVGNWHGSLRLHLTGDDDTVLWSFDLDSSGCSLADTHYHTYRLAGRWVYVVAREPSDVVVASTPAPATYHLLAIDVREGRLAQDVVVGAAHRCRIEDVDGRTLLVSRDDRELICFERRHV